MLKRRALFIALEAYWPLEHPGQTGAGLPPALLRVVSDYAALGFQIIPIFRGSAWGLNDADEERAFASRVERMVRAGAGVRIAGSVAMLDAHDPHVLWEAARQFDLDLKRSLLLTESGLHGALARSAGVARGVTLHELGSAVIAA